VVCVPSDDHDVLAGRPSPDARTLGWHGEVLLVRGSAQVGDRNVGMRLKLVT
jgi:hypothetical protein